MSGLSAVGVRIVTQRVRIVTNRCQDCYPKVRIVSGESRPSEFSLSKLGEDVRNVT